MNDSVTSEAITRKQERELLKFIKYDNHFSRYYEAIYILFNTGLRISEFCGLTIMGHSSITMTLDWYTHVETGDITKEARELMSSNKEIYRLENSREI